MGHDITAYAIDTGDEVAYLRRGAGNPLARVIYIALDAQSADAGCSGDGTDLIVDVGRLRSALDFCLENESDLAEIEGQPQMFKDLLRLFEQHGAHVYTGEHKKNLDQEVTFLHDCIKHCVALNVETIRIQFS